MRSPLHLTLAVCARRAALVLSLLAACGEPPAEEATARAFALSSPHTLYLNFDGATIKKSTKTSDAATNTSFIGGGTIPAYPGDAASRSKVASLVAQAFKAYNVAVVTVRPSSGDYQMGVIGGHGANLGIGATPAISPLDCGDANPRDIFFVFAAHMQATSTVMLAERVSQSTAHEAGHSLGLPHSNDPCDLMVSPFDSICAAGFYRSFLDKTMSCTDLTCGPSTTNSHQVLLKNLGPAQTSQPPPTPKPDSKAAPTPDQGVPAPDRGHDSKSTPAPDAGPAAPPVTPPVTPPGAPPATPPTSPASPVTPGGPEENEANEEDVPHRLGGGCAIAAEGGTDLSFVLLALLLIVSRSARHSREEPTVREYFPPADCEQTWVDEQANTRKARRGGRAVLAAEDALPSDDLGFDRPVFEGPLIEGPFVEEPRHQDRPTEPRIRVRREVPPLVRWSAEKRAQL